MALGALLLITACDSDLKAAERENAARATEVAAALAKVEPPVTRVVLTEADMGRICRAAIASLNGRDPAVIKVTGSAGNLRRVRYTRDDGTTWTNECRFGGGGLDWRTVENGQPGRWRTEDEVRFSINGKDIAIDTFMGGEPVTSDFYTID